LIQESEVNFKWDTETSSLKVSSSLLDPEVVLNMPTQELELGGVDFVGPNGEIGKYRHDHLLGAYWDAGEKQGTSISVNTLTGNEFSWTDGNIVNYRDNQSGLVFGFDANSFVEPKLTGMFYREPGPGRNPSSERMPSVEIQQEAYRRILNRTFYAQ